MLLFTSGISRWIIMLGLRRRLLPVIFCGWIKVMLGLLGRLLPVIGRWIWITLLGRCLPVIIIIWRRTYAIGSWCSRISRRIHIALLQRYLPISRRIYAIPLLLCTS